MQYAGLMTRRPISLTLAVWLVLHLLLGQQLALAHMVGHVGEVLSAQVGQPAADAGDEDREHGGAEALTHVCASCVSGLAPGLPMTARGIPLPLQGGMHTATLAVSPAPTFNPFQTYFSRAPPRLQD